MTGKIKDLLDKNELILMQGAVLEILRRTGKVNFHPDLIHSHLIYDKNGAEKLSSIFKSYIEVAIKADLPFVMCAPTWRANRPNVSNSGICKSLNIDAVKFMIKLRSEYPNFAHKINIGGTIGPKNDCYKPQEGLSITESETFHTWQIEQLIEGGADFIIAETLPSVNEAIGIAKAASKLKVNCIVSFVISRNGTILDGTRLLDAIKMIDGNVRNLPIGYSINCAHPTFLCADKQPKELFERLIGFIGNASKLDHCELENAKDIHVDNISEWGDEMLRLNRKFGIKMLGGCCGTDAKHISYLTTPQMV